MYRIGNHEPFEGLRLYLNELFAAMIDRSTDSTVFPACMVHITELLELRSDLLLGPSFFGQGQVPANARTLRNELELELCHCFRDVTLHA